MSLDYTRFDRIVAEAEEEEARMPALSAQASATVTPAPERHVSAGEARQARNLPRHDKEVWQVHVAKLRCWVGAETEETRPAFPTAREVVVHLLRAMLDPPSIGGSQDRAHRPAAISFADTALLGRCAQSLSAMGVEATLLSAAPGLAAEIQSFSSILVDRDVGTVMPSSSRGALLDAAGASGRLVRAYFQIARRFVAAAPWRWISESQTLRVCSDAAAHPDGSATGIRAGDTAWVAVLGQVAVAAADARRRSSQSHKEATLARAAAAAMRDERRRARGVGAQAAAGTVAEDCGSFHSVSSSEEEGDAGHDPVESLGGSDSVAGTRGLCVFFRRFDAERRLIVDAAEAAAAAAHPTHIRTQPAAAAVARAHPLDAVCAHCGVAGLEAAALTDAASCRRLQRCGRCKEASYCSVECQRAHFITHAPTCKARSVPAVPAAAGGGRYWPAAECVLLMEPPTSFPWADLDWLDGEQPPDSPASSSGLYPAELPLALAFHGGVPLRPSALELAWLIRGMAAVLATQGTTEAAAPAEDAAVDATRSALRAAVRELRPTTSHVVLPFDASEGDGAEAWHQACGELGTGLRVLLDPMLPAE